MERERESVKRSERDRGVRNTDVWRKDWERPQRGRRELRRSEAREKAAVRL